MEWSGTRMRYDIIMIVKVMSCSMVEFLVCPLQGMFDIKGCLY